MVYRTWENRLLLPVYYKGYYKGYRQATRFRRVLSTGSFFSAELGAAPSWYINVKCKRGSLSFFLLGLLRRLSHVGMIDLNSFQASFLSQKDGEGMLLKVLDI